MTIQTIDPTDAAQAARYSSAEVRAQLGRIRQSIDLLEGRARAISDPKRRALLTRCANAILAAFQTRAAADKIERTATNVMLLRLTEQETTGIMSTVKAHIDTLTDAYKGMDALTTALTIVSDVKMCESKPKANTAALRGVAAREAFDRARDGIKPKRWTVRDLSVIKRSGADAPPMVSLTASSDSIDLEGDRFTVSALRDMRRDMLDHACFVQHKYDPTDVFGMIVAAEINKVGEKHLLRLSVEVATANAKARNVYELIKSGVKLGASVGVIVLSGAPDKDNPKVFAIDHVRGLETSIVGLPANWEDGWVQSAKTAKAAS